MRIGITGRFQNSYFSGSAPQIACALARSLALEHDVTLLYPKGEPSWFIDVPSHADRVPSRKEFTESLDQYDVLIEVVWAFSPEDRVRYGKHVINFVHRPPMFHDMESVCYQWNPVHKSYKNLSAIWTYDVYSNQDVRYLEFLSGVPVYKVPIVWDADALDSFLTENDIPDWQASAKKIEAVIPQGTPMSISWCARIVESNFSNMSHCLLPLNIVSVIRQRGDPIRFTVHNGDHTAKNDFFKSNIANNLLVPDISGNMQSRVRLPDLRREKTFLIGHQRFRPFKSYLFDALYMGIPMIHNSALAKNLGAPYYYELNQIQQAVHVWKTMVSDYESSTGFFNPKAHAVRQTLLRSRFSPQSAVKAYSTVLQKPMGPMKQVVMKRKDTEVLRVAFCEMWDQFQPKYNFFMYLLSWLGKLNGIKVVEDSENPNVVFFGPLSRGTESKYPGIPKVYFTGENAPANKHNETILNIGFNYDTSPNYIRMPLWVTEINWWGADVNKMVNPKPVSLALALTVKPELLETKKKFCAFVATNGSNQNRNAAFQILNQWRGVDAGGRLFCNLPGGPIPAGLGGGGGELAKIQFYKQYKFALAFENSSSPGYTTEKLFHAKIAGTVPIYWGDPFVDRDFDSRGYINANQVSTPEQLIELVKKVDSNEEEWRKMASVPALSEYKKRWCQKTMEEVGKCIFKQILSKDIAVKTEDWATSESFGQLYESNPDTLVEAPVQQSIVTQAPTLTIKDIGGTTSPSKKIFVTATNLQFIESAANILNSLKAYEPDIEKVVYVWPDVGKEHQGILRHCGATDIRVLPTTASGETPWSDFWEPHHYAWKLWVHANAIKEAPEDACVLYLDAGTLITAPIDAIWNQIDKEGIFLLDDADQINERWCHPTCCKNLQITEEERKGHQITAGLLGYKKGSKYCYVAEKALAVAKEQRDTIVGEKWKAYSTTCLGHRHDQSILSILTHREKAPRVPLRDFYCDISMRNAKQNKLPLYVHRGHYRDIVPFADAIDEAYIINLERRKDRLDRFNTTHPTIKDRVYKWKATDGRALTLTKELVYLFRQNDFGWKKSVMGCALSHLGLWEKLANDSLAKQYLILEDDVRFEDRWLVKWMQAAKHIPKDADVIYLGGVLPPNKAAFPAIIEKVNDYFGRVAKNDFFGQARRYFHFCNYSYILTKSGATKLMELIKEKGIFTSGDHMIVNHGDELLNIYFTTPLLSSCFQEDDPVYQTSEFNNFKRVDNFDSDLWNNTDCFSKEEIIAIVEGKPIKQSDPVQIWNDFLKQIALNDKANVEQSIGTIFAIWNKFNDQEFEQRISWFRIFEQLILKQTPILMEYKEKILAAIRALPIRKPIWDPILAILCPKEPVLETTPVKKADTQKIFHLPMINPKGIYETEWLNAVFPRQIEWAPLNTLGDLANAESPTLLIQHIPGQNMAEFLILFDVLANANIKVNVLHLSDEFGNDDIRFYEKASVKAVIRNYWRSDLKQYGDKVLLIPLGYANGRSNTDKSPSFDKRANIWGFAGSADRNGRLEALSKLRAVTPNAEYTKGEWSQPNMLDGPGYCEMLRNAKFTPCFRGSKALESYRLYEAMEHGTIPVYVPSESIHTEDELKELFPVHPFVGIPSWDHAAQILPVLAQQTEVMDKHKNVIRDWWANKKAETKQKIAQLYSQ